MKRRAQITFFVLLGILFLIAMEFLFYIASSVKKDIEKEKEKTGEHIDTQSVIKSYISSCLEKNTKDALLKIGLDGGYIPEIKNETFIRFFDNKVTFGLTEPPYSTNYPPAPVPDYPYIGQLNKKDFPYFGKDTLHGLCDPNGPNRIGGTGYYRPCESYEIDNSIQEQLTKYITKKTKDCINFSVMRFEAHANGPLIVNLTIGNEDILSVMEYPITFSTDEKRIETNLFKHLIKIPVRLKALHEFAKALIKKDSIEAEFDILKDGTALPEFKGGFVLHKIQNACPNCKGNEYDDVISISDELSQIDGKKYIFQFARQNRIPAMEWIHDNPLVYDYDILLEENMNLELNPSGKDPDEENNLKYVYEKWKEDYDEYFDEECWQKRLAATPQGCVKKKDTPIYALTQSKIYLETHQNATLKMNHMDIGKHTVRISVMDRQGVKDYQDINIFVKDIPFYNITGKSPYHDIVPLIASIEDPFYLDADVRCIFWDCGKEYEWRIFKQFMQQPYQVYKTDKKSFMMPSLSPDINTILKEPFTGVNDFVKFKSGQFEFDLKGLKVVQCLPHRDADPNQAGVQDYNSTFQRNAAYPFNENGLTFYAPHLCCKGNPYDSAKYFRGDKFVEYEQEGKSYPGYDKWGTYEDANKICYELTKYICSPHYAAFGFDYTKFGQAKIVNPDGTLKDYNRPPDIMYTPESDKTWEDQNDIYKISFSQQCSGNRGNVCAGSADYKITLQEKCPDTMDPGQDERCWGPAGVTKVSCMRVGVNGQTCFAYTPGVTFEKIVLEAGNGFCNDEEKFSSGYGKGNYGTGGVFLCKAQCNGDGGCDFAASCKCPSGETYGGCADRPIERLNACYPYGIKCNDQCLPIPLSCP